MQNELFHRGSDLCILEEDKATLLVPRIEQRHVDALFVLARCESKRRGVPDVCRDSRS